MAQANTLDFLIAAHVSGQEQMAKLINTTGSLQKEIDRLKDAVKRLEAAQGTSGAGLTRYNAKLDEQSKALRNSRQGMQQLGMQFNDLATSISTGASPIQAFNQQLGQIGYAMSLVGGATGKLGAALAGPLGVAITMATMLLAPYIESLFKTEGASRDAALAANQLETEQSSLSTMQSALSDMFDMTTGKISNNTAQVRLNTLATILNSQAKAEALALEGKRVMSKAASGRAPLFNFDFGLMISGPEMVQQRKNVNALSDFAKSVESGAITAEQAMMRVAKLDLRGTGMKAEDLRQSILDTANAKALGKTAGDALKAFQTGILPSNFLKPSNKKERKAALTQAEKDAKKLAEATSRWSSAFPMEGINKASEVYDDYRIMMIKSAEFSNQRITALDDEMARNSIDRAAQMAREIGYISDDVGAKIKEGFIDRYTQIQSSFESIGGAVNDAFKGMLTGAMSWKDGMKGIINSVIDELWRLYVVQQIVGMVTKFLGNVTGTPGAPAASAFDTGITVTRGKAVGGYVAAQTPYVVGEKGPELFVPGGSGTIIPNKNMGGAGSGQGMVINVDARGSNDPAAVRAQVQQGILEAAPAIIAAAQSRTVQGLRRPRLGGAMQ